MISVLQKDGRDERIGWDCRCNCVTVWELKRCNMLASVILTKEAVNVEESF